MGKKGWHDRGYLPHFDSHGINQHVVFRLHDAVPAKGDGGDDVLGRHYGSCVLRDRRCANIVAQSLLHGDRERYALKAWCVMPNHVHALITTDAQSELGQIVRSWKTFTTRRINEVLHRSGQLWAADYFDRFIRDEKHFEDNKRYIEQNPVAAGLCATPSDWPFSSAGWR
jgi:REP element-mobilizing transposase RayT